MKAFVHFDADGTIHSVVTVDAAAGVRAMLEAEPGLSVAEIDDAEFQSAGRESDLEKVRELARTYRVAAPASRATLKKAD